MQLDRVVPWGRSLAEYVAMFELTALDLDKAIVDCGGGPASFNAELTHSGGRVVSCDPLYEFEGHNIRCQIDATYDAILAQVVQLRDRYVWSSIASPEELGRVRMGAMSQFLADYDAGLAESRYLSGQLPDLPFADRQFDLALCSHFLFTYADRLTHQLHVAAILDMCRIADEVRVFPLVDLAGQPVPYLDEVCVDLARAGCWSEIQNVGYEFQRGGNHMLRVRRD